MRVPRPRLTVRLLMAVVAIVALVLGGVRAREHYRRCMKLAWEHERMMKSRATLLKRERRLEESLRWSIPRERAGIDADRREAAEYQAKAAVARASRPFSKSDFDHYTEMARLVLEQVRIRERYRLEEEKQAVKSKRWSELNETALRYESRLRVKYLRAALRPWERIPPDPPPPFPHEAAAYWLERRDFARTLAEYRRSIEIGLDDSNTHNSYAWLLATCPDPGLRDGKTAIASATRACEMTDWKNAAILDTLAAAHAEAGDFDEAVRWQKATGLLASSSPERADFLARLELYTARKPYRDEPKGP